jgi:hypothetical protein
MSLGVTRYVWGVIRKIYNFGQKNNKFFHNTHLLKFIYAQKIIVVAMEKNKIKPTLRIYNNYPRLFLSHF